MILWPYAPNSITESLEFLTDVRNARDAEIRDSIKDCARHLDMAFSLPFRDAEQALELYRSQPLGQWIMPIWPEWSTGGSLSIADDVITCNTDASYRVGGLVYIGDGVTGETGTIASIAPGELTLEDGVDSAWVSPMIAPAEVGLITTPVQTSRAWPLTDVMVAFASQEPIDIADQAYPTLGGVAVLTDPSVLTAPLSGEVGQAAQLISSRMGVFDLGRAESYVRRRSTAQFFDRGIWARRQFLHYLRGRDAAFWLPTWQNDLPLQASALSGDTTITVQKLTPTAAQLVGRAIMIETPDGTLIPRAVTAASTILNTHVLTIAAPGVAVPQASKVSLMIKVRSDTDTFTFAHQFSPAGLLSSVAFPVIEVLE